MAREIVEIRVHGIGDQSGFRALGEPEGRPVNSWVVLRRPPLIPDHRLQLVNWWRANRRSSGSVGWYFAFPFTLANVAGRMSPGGHSGKAGALLRFVVTAASLVLTLSQLAWIIVLAETVLRYVPPLGSPDLLGRLVPPVSAAALVLLLAVRWFRHARTGAADPGTRAPATRETATTKDPAITETGTPVRTLAVHLAATAVAGVLFALVRPAQLPYGGWPSVVVPDGTVPDGTVPVGSAGTHYQLDAMAAWIIGSVVVLMLLSVLLCAAYWFSGRDRRRQVESVAFAGGVLTAGLLLMHSVTALIRMALDNLINYAHSLLRPGQPGALGWESRTLLGYDNPSVAGDSRLDLFPFMALILLIGLAAATAAVVVGTPTLQLRGLLAGRRERAQWWHRFIRLLPQLAPGILPLGGVLGAAGVAAAVGLGEGRLGGRLLGVAVLILQLGAAVAILSILLGQFPTIREGMAKVADAAGFWPIRDHPLAGVSYRQPVVEGVRTQLAGCRPATRYRPVLFAHSQGSVICAWLLATGSTPDGAAKPVFVSAGSPLDSLYGALFPAYFNAAFRTAVVAGSDGWTNFWRLTDPLGGPVRGARNVLLEETGSEIRGHSGYWDDPVIAHYIATLGKGRSAAG